MDYLVKCRCRAQQFFFLTRARVLVGSTRVGILKKKADLLLLAARALAISQCQYGMCSLLIWHSKISSFATLVPHLEFHLSASY